MSHRRLKMQQDIWTLKQTWSAPIIAYLLCKFSDVLYYGCVCQLLINERWWWWHSWEPSEESVPPRPPRKIRRRKCDKSSIPQPRIIRFRSNFAQSLNAWHPKGYKSSRSRGQRSRSQRDIMGVKLAKLSISKPGIGRFHSNFVHTGWANENGTPKCMLFLANVNSSSCSLYVVVRPSVICLSSVCNVRAPYSGDWNFRQRFYAIWYRGHPWPFGKNFVAIVSGEPLRRGS